MEIYLYANLSGTLGAPSTVIAFESREAVNDYINAAYEMAVLSAIDRYGKLPEGAETQDEFRTRVWHACVTSSELWTPSHVAQDKEKALAEREERKRRRYEPIPVADPDESLEF